MLKDRGVPITEESFSAAALEKYHDECADRLEGLDASSREAFGMAFGLLRSQVERVRETPVQYRALPAAAMHLMMVQLGQAWGVTAMVDVVVSLMLEEQLEQEYAAGH